MRISFQKSWDGVPSILVSSGLGKKRYALFHLEEKSYEIFNGLRAKKKGLLSFYESVKWLGAWQRDIKGRLGGMFRSKIWWMMTGVQL